MTLALLAIMLDEIDYVARWAQVLERAHFDQIVVVDGGSADGTVAQLRALPRVDVVERPFANHFAEQRNYGIERCTTDWILELDADEIPSSPFIGGLTTLCNDADQSSFDCVGIPRLNFLDGALVAGPGHKGLDYQYRLHRRCCHWRGAVHEEITGYRARHELLISDGHFLVHDKASVRHAARNDYYRTIAP